MIPYGKRPKTLPSVLSPEEVAAPARRGPAGTRAHPGADRLRVRLAAEELLHCRWRTSTAAAWWCTCARARDRRIGWCRLSPRLLEDVARLLAVSSAGDVAVSQSHAARPLGMAAASSGTSSRRWRGPALRKPATHAHAAAQLRHAPARSGRRCGDACRSCWDIAACRRPPVPAPACAIICSSCRACSTCSACRAEPADAGGQRRLAAWRRARHDRHRRP